MEPMRFQHGVFGKDRPRPGRTARIESPSVLLRQQLEACLGRVGADAADAGGIRLYPSLPPRVADEVRGRLGLSEFPLEEGYVIEVGREVAVYAATPRGLFYGCQSLMHLLRQDSFREALICDYPICPVRGLKVFLPAADRIPDFKRFVDMACRYKYNTLMIEIGGAMEYARHPEINEGWIEYCQFMNEYPGKGQEIQGRFAWEKNSIHSENGGGSFLSQAQVRALVDYCRERMIEVVPEVPSLSHCDYLLTRHPELAERASDPYPDTYCPSNPKSYELLFDVLDEVIDVFRPRTINVGHDEFYTMARCPLCRGKTGADLYAGDLARIHGHLAARGVKTMIWGEKLLDARFKSGWPIGGAARPGYPRGKLEVEAIPATFTAIDRVPSDLEILHWYWGIDRDLESAFFDRHLPVTFGNFRGGGVPDWRRRASRPGFQGVIVSNWGAMDEKTLQRNGILFDMVFCSLLLWNRRLDEGDYAAMRDWTLKELFEAGRQARRSAPDAGRLEIVHTTDAQRPYRHFVDGYFLEEGPFLLGHHVIHFANGKTTSVPVVYGSNISSDNLSWELVHSKEGDCATPDPHLTEAAYGTLPFQEGARTFYRIEVEDPFPGEAITRVEFTKAAAAECRVELVSCRRASRPPGVASEQGRLARTQ